MCCFSAPMTEVRNTRIFAARRPGGRQLVVYEMTFDASADAVAMVLPIPVAPGTGEDAVEFIDLTKDRTFFDRLYDCFDHYGAPGGGFDSLGAATAFRSPPPLVVHEVGVFEASYVPSRADFGRLDPRFRLSDRVLDGLGKRASRGFVVVKLATGKGEKAMHPLAFTFPSQDPSRLFYPTVHAHDGDFHADADYDHALYGTDLGRAATLASYGVEDRGIPAPRTKYTRGGLWHRGRTRLPLGRHAGGTLLDSGTEVFRAEVLGRRANDDTWVDCGPTPPDAEIVAGFVRAANAGAGPGAVVQALHAMSRPRPGLFSRGPSGPIDIVAVEPTRKTLPGVFRVHAENAQLRTRSHLFGAGSVLCALAGHGKVLTLESRAAVAAWAEGRELSSADRTWLDENAR